MLSNKSRAQHHRSLKLRSKLKCLNIEKVPSTFLEKKFQQQTNKQKKIKKQHPNFWWDDTLEKSLGMIFCKNVFHKQLLG